MLAARDAARWVLNVQKKAPVALIGWYFRHTNNQFSCQIKTQDFPRYYVGVIGLIRLQLGTELLYWQSGVPRPSQQLKQVFAYPLVGEMRSNRIFLDCVNSSV